MLREDEHNDLNADIAALEWMSRSRSYLCFFCKPLNAAMQQHGDKVFSTVGHREEACNRLSMTWERETHSQRKRHEQIVFFIREDEDQVWIERFEHIE